LRYLLGVSIFFRTGTLFSLKRKKFGQEGGPPINSSRTTALSPVWPPLLVCIAPGVRGLLSEFCNSELKNENDVPSVSFRHNTIIGKQTDRQTDSGQKSASCCMFALLTRDKFGRP